MLASSIRSWITSLHLSAARTDCLQVVKDGNFYTSNFMHPVTCEKGRRSEESAVLREYICRTSKRGHQHPYRSAGIKSHRANPFIAKYSPDSATRMETLIVLTTRDLESVTLPLIVGQQATGNGAMASRDQSFSSGLLMLRPGR